MFIHKIKVEPRVYLYLKKHRLIKQFKNAVEKLKLGNPSGLDFKRRKPKNLGIWSFRISKKYRAWATKENDILIIYKIDDHQ